MIDPRRPLVVMYHYIRPDAEPTPGGIRPMRASAFEAQLDALAARYDIVDADAFLARLDETGDRPPCLLTFDDGTLDHARVVTPILARRGLSGLFFIVSDAARGRLMPTTHLAHWLLGHDDMALWRRLVAFAREDEPSLGDPAEATRLYHYEPALRARVKYALNMALAPALARRFALEMLADAGGDETELTRAWFAAEADLRAMHAAGMTLGLHGRTHASLQQLGPAIGPEIEDCATFLTSITGAPPRWWACPFGGSGAAETTRAAMRSALTRVDVRAAVGTVDGGVPAGCDPLAIPRVDCIHLRRSIS